MFMNYDIVLSKNYQKDLKKARKRYKNIDGCIDAVSNQLKNDVVDARYYRHKLIGRLNGMSAVHVKPDCILIYTEDDELGIITYQRLGSHANIIENRVWADAFRK